MNLNDTTLFDLWQENFGFTSGCGYRYPQGLPVSGQARTLISVKAIEPAIPGKNLLSISLITQLGGNSVQLLGEMPADRHFHLFVYAGRSLTSEAFIRLSEILSSPTSPIHCFSRKTPHHLDHFHQADITSAYLKTNFDYVVNVSLFNTTPH